MVSPALARGQDALPWLPAEGKPNVTLHPPGKLADGPVAQVAGQPGQKTVTTVLEVKDPRAPSHHYVLRGRVKVEGVEGAGYVELLNTLPGRGTFFTRTLAEAGPMQKLAGTSDWRDLELPFFSDPGLLPEKLVVNVVLPGKGTVYLTPLTLSAHDALPGGGTAWWDAAQSNRYGGLAGAGVGVIGALIGTLAGFGVARRLVLTVCVAMVGLGVAALLAGVTAATLGQPHHVFFPLLLLGLVMAPVFGFNLPVIRRRYAEGELRRMTALDA